MDLSPQKWRYYKMYHFRSLEEKKDHVGSPDNLKPRPSAFIWHFLMQVRDKGNGVVENRQFEEALECMF